MDIKIYYCSLLRSRGEKCRNEGNVTSWNGKTFNTTKQSKEFQTNYNVSVV
jgi:hypothetical protein